jgi:cytochrome c oxidase cbb3-type subunit 3
MSPSSIFRLTALCIVVAGCERGATRGSHGQPGSPALPQLLTNVGPIPGKKQAFAPPENPLAEVVDAPQSGRQLFVRFNCSGCHGGRAGGGMGPSLRDVDWRYGSGDAAIFASIAEGRSQGMPAWGTKLPEQQIWQLVSYIQSLRTDREPHPPGGS